MCLCQTILWRMIQTDSDQALIDHRKENLIHIIGYCIATEDMLLIACNAF